MGIVVFWLMGLAIGVVGLIILIVGLVFFIRRSANIGWICTLIGLIAIYIALSLFLHTNDLLANYCPTHMANCG